MSIILCIVICALLIGTDQFTKYLVVEYLKDKEQFVVIENVLSFRYVENTGAVFGSFAAHTIVLTVVSIILIGVVIFYLLKNKNQSKFINICLLLMISGGIGNVIDRIRLKYVIDFIEPLFVNFAVFNFADCLITVGAFALMFYLIIDLVKDFKNSKSKTEKTNESD